MCRVEAPKKKPALKNAYRMKIFNKDLVFKIRKVAVSFKNEAEHRCMGNTVRTFKHLCIAKNKL